MSDNPDDMTPVDVLSAQAAKGQMDPIPAAIEGLNQRILAGREGRLALTDRVSLAEGKVTTLQSQMATEQARVIPADRTAAITALQTSDTTQNGQISTLQTQMQAQQARVIPPDLSSAVTAVQTKNTAQDGRLDAVEAKNTAQDGRITTLEARTPITRIETYTATSNASGLATFTFPAFTEILDIRIKPTWIADQYVGGGVTAQTLTGCTVLVKRSRGTLLLTSGPFETGPTTPVTIVVYGR